MNLLYLDCGMGAAGDMLAAALLDLLPEEEQAQVLRELAQMGLTGVEFVRSAEEKCGIRGTRLRVLVGGREETADAADLPEAAHGPAQGEQPEHAHTHEHTDGHGAEDEYGNEGEHEHEHEHRHSSPAEIASLVESLALPEPVRRDVLAVYGSLAEAESHAHGVPVEQIHFHEVGRLDAVADIAAVALLMHRLAPEKVLVSPVHVGSGQVRCAHGLLPVPAPATAYLLRGVPIYGGAVAGELCTPTGAALLRYYASEFGAMPPLRVARIGYGMGKRDFPAANCVRAFLGQTADLSRAEEPGEETVLELCCNVDDMTPEALGFALEQLRASGALEAYTVPVGMKKSRPGVLLCVLCAPEARARMTELLFRCTSTIGIREAELRRHVLRRETETVHTSAGPVRRKIAQGYGVRRAKYEYDDLARIARQKGIGLEDARRWAEEEGRSAVPLPGGSPGAGAVETAHPIRVYGKHKNL